MAVVRTFPSGFKIWGGKLTKQEEADFYRRIGGGPQKTLRSSPRCPVAQPAAPEGQHQSPEEQPRS
jgi:hypothetical protein